MKRPGVLGQELPRGDVGPQVLDRLEPAVRRALPEADQEEDDERQQEEDAEHEPRRKGQQVGRALRALRPRQLHAAPSLLPDHDRVLRIPAHVEAAADREPRGLLEGLLVLLVDHEPFVGLVAHDPDGRDALVDAFLDGDGDRRDAVARQVARPQVQLLRTHDEPDFLRSAGTACRSREAALPRPRRDRGRARLRRPRARARRRSWTLP